MNPRDVRRRSREPKRAWRAAGGIAGSCLVAGCGTEVAQTAFVDPNQLLNCSAPGADVLPDDAVFGDGGEPPSVLIGTAYGATQGPGLYVTARDAFRVYLNGDLVAASSAPRTPVFVPLSLLPGDNAVAVVVAAKHGTPVALLQLDELSASYVSDATWKVSTAPTAGYSSPSYDDSSWVAASDYGAVGSLPGCDPPGTFATATSPPPHWIGPGPDTGSTAVLRTVIPITPIGYGAATTGAGNATPTVVSTWADLQAAAGDPSTPALILLPEGVYDFRNTPTAQSVCPSTCTENAPQTLYTILTSSQSCAVPLTTQPRDDRTLSLGSNKTIVGLARGADIRGVTFDFGSSQNVIVRNLGLFGVDPALVGGGSAFSLGQSNQVWIDHGTTKWISNGFSGLGAGAQNVTLSWMHYDGVTSYECDGEHTLAVTIVDSTATLHHCFFDHVESHSPKVQNGTSRVHVLNNLLSDNVGYGVGSVCGAQVLMEGNAFQRVATPTERDTCVDGGAMGMIQAPPGSNFYGDDVGPNHGGGGDGGEPRDPVFVPPYSYTVDGAQGESLTVQQRAGAGSLWAWAIPLSLN